MRKKSVFYRILLADIGIVFVLIFIMIPLCNQVIRTIRERELNDSYNVMLNSINVLDSQIKNLESILTKAYVNENLVRISIIDKEIKNSDYYAIRKGQQYVAALSSSNSYVEDIIIIFKSSGIVLTKKTSFDSIDAFNKYYNIDNFLNITNSKDPTYILSTSYNYIPEIAVTDISSESSSVSNKKIDVFCYKIPLGLPIYPKENGIAYIFINKNRLLNTALPHNFRKDGFFCLLDKNGNTILSYGTNLELSSYKKQLKFYNQYINKIKYSIVSVSNDTNTLHIVAGIPHKTFISSIRSIFVIIGFYIATAAILGIIASYYVAYRQTAPLKELLNKFRLHGFDTKETYRDEYEFISNSFNHLKSENINISEQLNEYKTTIKNNMIERLLCSAQLSKQQQDNILTYLSDFPMNYIIGYGEFNSQLHLNKQDLDVINLLVINRIKEHFPQNTIYHSLDSNAFVLIIPSNKQHPPVDIIKQAIDKINSGISPKIALAISNTYSSIANVNIAFEQARFVYKAGNKSDSLLTFSNLIYPDNSTLDIKDFLNLHHCLIAADFSSFKQYIRKIFNFTMDVKDVDMEQLYYAIRMILLLVIKDHIGSKDIIFDIPKYQSNQSPERLIDTLLKISHEICEVIDNNKRSHNAELKNKILEFINKNFTDNNLYGRLIAEKFSISEKYLYNFIKEQTGQSVGEYLQHLRLEYAKTLIKDCTNDIASIYKKCGYTTYNTFYKAFKRVYGMSPSEYRDRYTNLRQLHHI